MKRLRLARRLGGFTLIEMLITVAIVGLLASISFPLVQLTAKRAKEHELHDALRKMRSAIDAYKQAVDEGHILMDDVKGSGYPPNLDVLVNGVVDAKNAQGGQKIYFLRRLPMDPMFPESQQLDAVKWGIRSYASPPDNPQSGVDVFDVYSLAPGVGLNGVPYRDW